MASHCWASEVSPCRGSMSREHTVSGNLFSGKTVVVSGFPWCEGKTKRIGVAAHTRWSYCRGHNSELSPLDAEGGRTFRAIGQDPRLPPRHVTVSGWLFERWVLKTVLNVLQDGEAAWPDGSPRDERPPLPLLRRVFGTDPITSPMGLYAEDRAGQWFESSEDVRVIGHLDLAGSTVGATVVLQGTRWLMWLVNWRAPEPHEFFPEKPRLIYRPFNMDFGDSRISFAFS